MRTSRRIAACAALSAGAVVAAGPAVASPLPDVAPKRSCKLLTVSEARRILATPVGAGKQQTKTAQGITGDRCVWEVVVESGTTLVNDYNMAKSADPTETDAVPGLGDDAFIKDLKLHVLVGDRVLSTALHNYRYPKPLTQEQIQQKDEDAAKLALGRLSPS